MSLAVELGLIYLVSKILLTLTRRSRSKTGTKQDRSTLGTIWLVIAVSITAGVFVALNSPAAALPNGRILSLRNWAALLVILVPIGTAFIHRISVEEDALSRALGLRYAEYVKHTKRLLPFVY